MMTTLYVKNRPCVGCWELAATHVRSKCPFQPTHYTPLSQQVVERMVKAMFATPLIYWCEKHLFHFHFLEVSSGYDPMLYYAFRATDHRGRVREAIPFGTLRYSHVKWYLT